MISEIRRVPLAERGFQSAWTSFEAQLFNLVTAECHRMGEEDGIHILFSKRLAITQLMLDQFDQYLKEKYQ